MADKKSEVIEQTRKRIMADKKVKAPEQTHREHVEKCIKEYNDAEVIQETRLRELFYELKKRNGYRRVRFSSGKLWSNFWGGGAENRDKARFLDQFSRTILEAEIGED